MTQALLFPVLLPGSGLYWLGLAGRKLCYGSGLVRVERVSIPVISIGNITAGGTGKTPMTEWVARVLLSLGKRPAILSRGYKALQDGEGRPVNDESLLLTRHMPNVPHVVDPNRARGARHAVAKRAADCAILDDGFQHWRLERDLDIVLLDALDPFGGGCLLPAGRLREPAAALRRAHVVVITRSRSIHRDALQVIRRKLLNLAPKALFAEAVHEPVELQPLHGGPNHPAEWLRGRRVFAFCGIGNPQAFLLTLRGLDADVVGAACFADHHHYDVGDLARIWVRAREAHADTLITTQKDAVKISYCPSGPPTAFALGVQMDVIAGGSELRAAIRRVVMHEA